MKYNSKNLKAKKKAKYGITTKKKLPLYAEAGIDIPNNQVINYNNTIPDEVQQGFNQTNNLNNDPIALQQTQKQNQNIPGVTSDSAFNSNSSQEINNSGKQKQGSKAGNFLRNQINGKNINSNDIFAGELQAINALLPYQQPKDNTKPLVDAYNPFPNGTGSHASFKFGGKAKKSKNSKKSMADNGIALPTQDFSPITPQERTAWENMQGNAHQQGFLGDDHNRQPGTEFMKAYGVDPSRLPAFQQDFQNLQGQQGRTRAGNDGYSKVDDFYGHKTAQQRYTNYEYEHLDSKGNRYPGSQGFNNRGTEPMNQNEVNNWTNSAYNNVQPIENINPIQQNSNEYIRPEGATAPTKPIRGIKKQQNPNFHTNQDTNYSVDSVRQMKDGGKTKPPIYTSDRNDPRLQRYQDSLALRNYSEKDYNAMLKAQAARIPTGIDIYNDVRANNKFPSAAYNRISGNGMHFVSEEKSTPFKSLSDDWGNTNNTGKVVAGSSSLYAAPKQPYKYQLDETPQLPISQPKQFPTPISQDNKQYQQVDSTSLNPANYQYNGQGRFVPDEYHKQLGYPDKNNMKKGGKIDNKNIATQQDSLDIYNNAKKVQEFYNNTSEYYKSKTNNYNIKKFNELNDSANFKVNSDIKNKHTYSTPLGDRVIKPEEYRKDIDKNKYYQREQQYEILNTNAPMQLFDKRITPQYGVNYSSKDSHYHDRVNHPVVGDEVDIMAYDPIAVKPYSMLTPEEKVIRDKKYPQPKSKWKNPHNREMSQLPIDEYAGEDEIIHIDAPNYLDVPSTEYLQGNDIENSGHMPTYTGPNGEQVMRPGTHGVTTDKRLKNGGQIVQGENGLYVNGGSASKLGENMFTGDTIQFNGPSHNEGGIDIQYGKTPVEVEGGETAFVDKKGDMNVFGNLYVPGTNTKFKDMGKKIAKEEQRNSKMANRGSKLINDSDPTNKYENSTFNTGAVLQDAYEQNQKELANTKEFLATTQDKMLNLAKFTGAEPKDISKAFKGEAKYGKRIAKDGDKVDPEVLAEQTALMASPKYKKAITEWQKSHPGKKPFGNKNRFDDGLQGDRTEWVKNYMLKDTEKDLRSKSRTYDSSPLLNIYDDTSLSSNINGNDHFNPVEPVPIKPIEDNPTGPRLDDGQFYSSQAPKISGMDIPEFKVEEDQKTQSKPINKKTTFLRDKLGLTDILPELSTMFDRAEPVTRQQYNPQLLTPYQVSFDDRIEGNQGDFNAIQKTMANNPAALGAISAQKYNADNQVRGEEFRTNQGITNDVINKNTQILNQAGMTNLQLGDEQYVRQSQAEENARSNRFAAMESLSTKFGQQRRDNTTMKMYEDMYHYGYNPKTGYTHTGPDFQLGPVNSSIQPDGAKKVQTKKYNYNSNDDKTDETDVTYAMGGSMSGGSYMGNRMAGRFSGGQTYSDKKKKRKMKQ